MYIHIYIYTYIYMYLHTYIHIFIYPPTPAYAKAGAAPGTTGGVELGSFVACQGNNGIPTPQAPRPHP